MILISLSDFQFCIVVLLPVELIFLVLLTLIQSAVQITPGWTWTANCSENSGMSIVKFLVEFYSIHFHTNCINGITQLPGLSLSNAFHFSSQTPSCFLCLPTKYAHSIHNSLSVPELADGQKALIAVVHSMLPIFWLTYRYLSVPLNTKTALTSGTYDQELVSANL